MGTNGKGDVSGKKAVYDMALTAYTDAEKALKAPAEAYIAAKKISDPLEAKIAAAKVKWDASTATVGVTTTAIGPGGVGKAGLHAKEDDAWKAVITDWT